MSPRYFYTLLRETCLRWYEDNTFRLGAALAFYTVFSIAPIVMIAVSLGGLVFEEAKVREQFGREIATVAGERVGEAIVSVSQAVEGEDPQAGVFATLLSVVFLLVGATSVFGQLQDALNTIWGVQPKPNQPWWKVVKDRFWSFTMVLVIGFLLMVSLVASTGLTAASDYLGRAGLPGGPLPWQVLNALVSYALVTFLFALIYKVLPDVKIAWKDVWVGAALTALLFGAGKYLIGLYIARSSWINAYGAAGSLVVVLLWVYYSSQILLFGAAFTEVYAAHAHKRIKVEANAEPVTAEARARQGLPRETVRERVAQDEAAGEKPAG